MVASSTHAKRSHCLTTVDSGVCWLLCEEETVELGVSRQPMRGTAGSALACLLVLFLKPTSLARN